MTSGWKFSGKIPQLRDLETFFKIMKTKHFPHFPSSCTGQNVRGKMSKSGSHWFDAVKPIIISVIKYETEDWMCLLYCLMLVSFIVQGSVVTERPIKG